MPKKNNQTFWDKLKSRNVIRVAIAYSITAWLLMQIASIVLPAFEAPNWVLKAVIFLLVLGLPIALLMSWFFEMTSDGLKKSKNVTIEESDKGGKKVRNIIYVVLSLSVIYLLYDKFFIAEDNKKDNSVIVDVYIPEKSIAVLPFKNLSGTDENELFSNAIMEAILNNLSRLKDIKVVSSTSVERYRESKLSIKQIGKELEIAYILEGSVQRIGDRVRISAKLISAKTDKHLWSENYDRNLEDIFEIQTEIANAISDNLRLLITHNERELMENAPTTNLMAFDLWLQAMHVEKTSDNIEEETKLLQQALSLDPDFYYPYLEIADNILNQAYSDLTPDEVWKDTVLTLIDKAIEVSPNSDLAYNYKRYYYDIIQEPEKGLFYLYKALELNPNEPFYKVLVGNDKLKNGLIDEGVELKIKALTSIPEIEVKEKQSIIRYWLNMLDSDFRYEYSLKNDPNYWSYGYFIRNRKFDELEKKRLDQDLDLDLGNHMVILAQAHSFNENYEEAISLFEKRMSQSQGSNQGFQKYGFEHRYAHALIQGGNHKKGVEIMESYIDTLKMSISKNGIKSASEYYDLALSNAALGNKEEAIKWLKTDLDNPINQRNDWYLGDRMLDPIREEPEFKAIIKEILDKEAAISKVFHEKLKEYQARGELLWLNLD